MNRVFVYGTLKKGGRLHSVLSRSTYLGEHTTTPDYTMYDLGMFPGVKDNGKTPIKGEVYEVDTDTLYYLDAVESHPTLYKRELIPTPYGDAWIYILQRFATKIVESGEWSVD